MGFQPGANLYTAGFGSRPENVEVPHLDVRAPSTTDNLYPLGKLWLYVNNSLWYLLGQSSANGQLISNWVEITSASGSIVAVNGTPNQITAVTAAGVVTLSIPSTFIAPGSIASTTTLTGGTGITATTGNIVASSGNVSASGTVTGGTGVIATTGNLTATAGNLALNGVTSKININVSAPTTASAGLVTLSGAATTTLTSSAITASSIILFSLKTVGTVATAADSAIAYTVTGGSATITPADSTDTSVYGYLIIN